MMNILLQRILYLCVVVFISNIYEYYYHNSSQSCVVTSQSPYAGYGAELIRYDNRARESCVPHLIRVGVLQRCNRIATTHQGHLSSGSHKFSVYNTNYPEAIQNKMQMQHRLTYIILLT